VITRNLIFASEASRGVSPDVATTLDNGTNTAITYTRLPSGLWVHNFNGTTSKITLASTVTKLQTVVFWMYPTSNTRAIMGFDGGTHLLSISAGNVIVATGWDSPVIYVNDILTATIALNVWNYITVKTTNEFNATATIIGNATTWFVGYLTMIKFFNKF
jgi:hypothetical protein